MTTQTPQPIIAAIQLGDLAEAERLCRNQLQEQPDDETLLLLMAMSLQHQGKLAEAAEIYARFTELFPQSGLHWGNYATLLGQLGRIDEALKAYAVAFRLAPENVDQLVNFGLLQLQQREYVAARETLLKAYTLDSQSPMVRIHTARACSHCRDPLVDELLKPWKLWTSLDPTLQLELANLLLTSGDANAAQIVLEDLIRRTPTEHVAKLRLAAVYERQNRLQEADALLQRIAVEHPVLEESARHELSYQRAILALRHGDLGEARATLELNGPRDQSDCAHYFVLAEIYDKLGETKSAMDTLAVAHALQIEELKISVPSRFAPGSPILPAAVTKVTADDYQRWPKLIAPDAQHSPIFIVGFPRSGTTLLEQMLDAHPGLQSMDERPFFNILSDDLLNQGVHVPQDIYRFNQRDCDELRKRYVTLACDKVPRKWGTQLVDKNPLNILWLPLIHRLFPNAKFVFALRHPCDVLLSCYMQNFQSSVLAMACTTLERLATAYVVAMKHWLYHIEVFHPDVMISRYEDLVADTPQQTRRIAEFLGIENAETLLQFDQHARDKGFIATPSYTQVIKPVNKKAINRWIRYRHEFESALPILQPMLRHWGYSTD